MRLIDADALKADFENRARKARNWKEHAIMARDEEIEIRATATLDFIYEVIMTIDRAPAVDLNAELIRQRATGKTGLPFIETEGGET